MIIACLIISGLALLAAVANIILFFTEKKRDLERRHALLDYINNTCDGAQEAAENFVVEYFSKKAECFKTENNEFFVTFSKSIGDRFNRLQKDVDDLKNGAVPNYEAAMAAATAVNDFNAGISAIMNFDPIDAARRRRQSADKEVG